LVLARLLGYFGECAALTFPEGGYFPEKSQRDSQHATRYHRGYDPDHDRAHSPGTHSQYNAAET
jgi:hypothetical protein